VRLHGALGPLQSVYRYVSDRKSGFETYTVWHIQGELGRYPLTMSELRRKSLNATQSLTVTCNWLTTHVSIAQRTCLLSVLTIDSQDLAFF
jgi:DNA-directed RNA polymerase sigma subunit (sigma70/sigma32)